MPFLRVGFVGFLNCGYGFLGFYVGCFVSALFSFWTSPSFGEFFMLGDGAVEMVDAFCLWFTPVIQGN